VAGFLLEKGSCMLVETEKLPLADHTDLRLTSEGPGRNQVVVLDPDHPGFRDAHYRARRNQIAALSLSYVPGGPIPDVEYTDEEHEVWRTVWQALVPAHQAYACAEYLNCANRLEFLPDRIPQLSEVSQRVELLSGFHLEPVAGLVEPRTFLDSLASGTFLCTQYIRHHSTPFYTPEPDVIHELAGHAVTLASPRLAELNREFGRAVKRTRSSEAFDRISRLYWFTIEFGVLLEEGGLKAYGTGLLSSAGELAAMSNAELRPLDPEAASQQTYDPTRYQQVLFYAQSFDAMYQMLSRFLGTC
jgi:phenylalanine-4-hydroxylase